jgi:hypothetical protein
MTKIKRTGADTDEIRLQTAEDLIYGNLDKDKIFPFDPRNRFEYLVYYEKLAKSDDGDTVFSKKTTRRFQFFTPEVWEGLIRDSAGKRRNFFERKGLSYTILHDPKIQAKKEGVLLGGTDDKIVGTKLAERLSKAKSAEEYVAPELSDDEEEVVVPKRAAVRRKGAVTV